MDETYLWQLFGVLIKEMALYIVAIMVMTQLLKDAVKWVPNQLISILVGLGYGIGAWATGYLTGTWYEVILIKSPLAIVFAQAFHERLYKVLLNQGSEAISNIVEAVKSKTNGGTPPPEKENP